MEKKPLYSESRAIISTSFFVKVTGYFFSLLIVTLSWQIVAEMRITNLNLAEVWFFLNYLRKLRKDGTFSQLNPTADSARIGDYFLTDISATIATTLHYKECK